MVTPLSLGPQAFGSTLPIPLGAALARWIGLRWLALPVMVLLWHGTWRPTEALRELFLHPIHTPLVPALPADAAWTLTPRR